MIDWPMSPILVSSLILLSVTSCATRTAPSSQLLPPAACTQPCLEYPTQPPTGLKVRDWLKWGDDVSEDYRECAVLHNTCVAETTRRFNSDKL